MRVCLEPGCPILTERTRCLDHQAQRERARGTRQQRGYTTEHQRLRAHWLPIVRAGGVTCARQGPNCTGQPLAPHQAFDLGHDDYDRTKWTGPECIPCNRATAGRKVKP